MGHATMQPAGAGPTQWSDDDTFAPGHVTGTGSHVGNSSLIARGDSTSEIARGMFLSRRTVQTYISHILAKLGVKSRVEIVREALRHGVCP
jgi:hypothetical protein